MSADLRTETYDWVATDLDGTLFSRHWAGAGAVPGTWQEIGGDSSQRKPSSWVRPETYRLLLTLASVASIVPVTARDEASFSRVAVSGLRLSGPAILANGAIVLDPDGALDQQWVARVSQVLAPWQQRLKRLCEVFIQRSGHAARPRLVAGPAELPAYLVAKAADGWWAGAEGTTLLSEMAAEETAGCCVAVLGNELQILPPGLGKATAMQFVQQRYFGGQAPLLCLGDQVPDLGFMCFGGLLATPVGSPLAGLWNS
jgi:hydroxymethylpyrimidine pyrophosphatase-like HAD family hydrolase